MTGVDILLEQLNGGLLAAAVQDGRLEGLEVDSPAEEVRWGSIYWAKVARIDKALDAAFVNLDGDNIGILHNADIMIAQEDGTYKKGGDAAIGKTLTPGQMVAVQAKSAFIANDPSKPYAKAEGKSPVLTMNIVLHGRYTIHTPFESANRISRRIRSKALRQEMEAMLGSLVDCHGCILRAAAAHTQTDILIREARILTAAWRQIKQFFTGDDPQLIMQGPDALQRVLSDYSARLIERIELTTMDHFALAEEWCDVYAPDLVTKIRPVELEDANEELALFDHRDIVRQIEALFHPYVVMKKGGSLIIQETAALTAIDVNAGQDKRAAAEINADAAAEIARQLRLRNLGGAIVIDFLKMKGKADRDQLKDTLQSCFDADPCTVQIHDWTALGMLEVTRHRRTPPLMDRFEGALE